MKRLTLWPVGLDACSTGRVNDSNYQEDGFLILSEGVKILVVSVLMCTNRIDEYFERAVDSILGQQFDDFELIVVGNGLTPDHVIRLQALESQSSKVKVLVTHIRHITFSLNFGLHHCGSDLIARMDADDIAHPERLAQQFDFMQTHPRVAVCGSAFDLIDEKDRSLKRCMMPTKDSQIRKALYWTCPLCHPSVIFRKSIVARAGGYTGYIFAQDYDLWCRLWLDRNIEFANLDSVLLGYRTFATGAARRSKQGYAAVSASQWRNFVLTGNPLWGIASLITSAKRLARSRQ